MLVILLLLLPSLFAGSANTERNRDQFIRYKMLMHEWSIATLRGDSLGLIGFFDPNTRQPTQTNISLAEFYRNAEVRDCSGKKHQPNSLSRLPKFTRLLRHGDLLLMLESQRGDVVIFDPATVHAVVLRFAHRVLDFAVVEDHDDRSMKIYYLARTNRVLNTLKWMDAGSAMHPRCSKSVDIHNVFATSPRDGRIYVNDRTIYTMTKVASKLFITVLRGNGSTYKSKSHVLQPVSSDCQVSHFSVSLDDVLLINLRCQRDNRSEFYYAKKISTLSFNGQTYETNESNEDDPHERNMDKGPTLDATPDASSYWLSPGQKEIATSLSMSILTTRQSLGLHLSQSGNLFVQSLLHPAYLAATFSSTDRSSSGITRSTASFSLANQLEFCQVALNTPVPVANNLGTSTDVVDMVVRFDLLVDQFPSYLSVCAGRQSAVYEVPSISSTVPTVPAVVTRLERLIYGMVRNFSLGRPNLQNVPLLSDGDETNLIARVNASLQQYNLYTDRQDRLIDRLRIGIAALAGISSLLVLIVFATCIVLIRARPSSRSSSRSSSDDLESSLPLDGLYRRYPDPE